LLEHLLYLLYEPIMVLGEALVLICILMDIQRQSISQRVHVLAMVLVIICLIVWIGVTIVKFINPQ
ncbi:MAG: hypothetical protein CSA95_00115, partial [Bacteroidetes bacterium]